MIRYALISREGQRATYTYAVEGRSDDTGTVLVDLANDTIDVTEQAPTDKAVGYPMYGFKMREALDTFKRSGDFKESGIVAWY